MLSFAPDCIDISFSVLFSDFTFFTVFPFLLSNMAENTVKDKIRNNNKPLYFIIPPPEFILKYFCTYKDIISRNNTKRNRIL